MSLETLDIYRDHREEQLENGPFSETFQIVGGSTFKGVFDRSHMEENKDSGNVRQKKLYPRILVSEVPSGLTPNVTKIQREEGTEFTFKFSAIDDEGIEYLWLF